VARTLSGSAYCAKTVDLKKGPKRVTATSSSSVAVLGQSTAAAPGCPKGRSVSAGGYESPFPTPGTPRALYLVSRLSGSNWIATALGGFSAGSLSVTSQATCT
jgi:hypothetical protein